MYHSRIEYFFWKKSFFNRQFVSSLYMHSIKKKTKCNKWSTDEVWIQTVDSGKNRLMTIPESKVKKLANGPE